MVQNRRVMLWAAPIRKGTAPASSTVAVSA